MTSGTIQEVGFEYATDDIETTRIEATPTSDGHFTATLIGLAPGANCIYQAYAIVAGTGDKSSVVKTFKGEDKLFSTLVESKAPAATVSNGTFTITGETSAVLSATYSNASATPSEVGFWWGSSSSEMSNQVIATDKNGTFTATLTGLIPGQDVVFQPYVKVSGTGTYASDVREFWATSSTYFEMPGNAKPAIDKDWLELPAGMDDASDRYIVSTTYSGERNYSYMYDTQMMASLWTAYPLNSSHMGSLSRPSDWSYNPDIPQQYQVKATSSAYGDTGYSRGHMCPNASRNGNSTMQKQTFYVTNQVPQRQNKFNGSIWANLEKAVQGVASKEEVYVVTGVAFNKSGETKTVNYISPSADASQKVPIPNYFYKVVLRVKKSGSTVTDACTVGFWFEHRDYVSGTETYQQFSASVDQIEEWTGFDFFVNLPDDIEEAAESRSTSWSQFSAW